jgi:hypothetical protein
MVDREYTNRLAAILSTDAIFDTSLMKKKHKISSAKTASFFCISIRDLCFMFLIVLFCISLPWGCGYDDPGVSTEGLSENGSASLAIRWHDTQLVQTATALQHSIDCQASGIEHVVCTVYDTSTDTLLLTGGPWDCEAHGAAIKGIPAGQDRTFVLLAEDSKGNVKWRGEATGVSIIAGETNENVSVDAYPFVPTLIFPNNGDIVDPASISFSWEPCADATEYIVQVAKDEEFSEGVVDQTTPGSTYETAILTPSTEYYWKISGVDRYANIGAESETRHFITSDCSYSISPTTNTISSSGGTGRFDVSASSTSCQWTAEASATWVTITSDPSGIGDGTVTYTVSPNTGASRTSAISIDGQTHTVRQEPTLGSLKVTLYPSNAVSEGARWRVDEGDWNRSGYTQSGLSVGNHRLEFKPISGWIKPDSQTVRINNNQTTTTSGEYRQHTVIDLSVYAYKIRKYKFAYLTWSGANSRSVDVYRDGSIIATTPNDGAYTHGPFEEGGPATYHVCEAKSSTCSNRVTVKVTGDDDDDDDD